MATPNSVADAGSFDSKQSPSRPWIFRTYAGHTSPEASNALYRSLLAQGQTGLSVAFDLPTQCGYDSDHPLALAEAGRAGVPVNSIEDMRILFDGIPLEHMNTSMTINATSAWLLSLYIALAQERGIDASKLSGTTQNDMVKEFLARGTYIFPPDPSQRITAEVYEYCSKHLPNWNPGNICSYHLQEAGATPVQEAAFALSNAVDLMAYIRSRGIVPAPRFADLAGRFSFFMNAGIRIIEELCKIRACTELWDEILHKQFGIEDPKNRVFRYGVQVNSLNLTKVQPENNVWRIALESLSVVLSRKARCRAMQLPAWNEAITIPEAEDQQWSLRLQQILAFETDILEYSDIFEGSDVIRTVTDNLKAAIRQEMKHIADLGGTNEAIKNGYLKQAMLASFARRMERICSGEQTVVGQNRYTDSMFTALRDKEELHLEPDAASTERCIERLKLLRKNRDGFAVRDALDELKRAAKTTSSIMEPSIRCARVGVSTGEWADALRSVFGEYRSSFQPTSVRLKNGPLLDSLHEVRHRTQSLGQKIGKKPRILVAKAGLDGHSNGAEWIALAANEAGFDVVYAGLRTPAEELLRLTTDVKPDAIGFSILSGAHLPLIERFMSQLHSHNAAYSLPVFVGGAIPEKDFFALQRLGVARIFTSLDFRTDQILMHVLEVIEAARAKNLIHGNNPDLYIEGAPLAVKDRISAAP